MQPNVVPRSDLTQLLGQNLLEGQALAVSREYGLMATQGARTYESREFGVRVAVDEYDTVSWVMLHFNGDSGFQAFRGAIPGRGGTIPRRSSLWAALGRPAQSTDPSRTGRGDVADEWVFPWFVMHAQYAPEGEMLLRLTLLR
ncbi:hypothetical protein JIG36_38295 [Actinoplanes sp. LDG1-06]|uniref:Uncharacterized protein n=1 Tax=Paractinoplanes ovalisporus TaxID=2810368 RepID=A0ABS2ANL6_9ACTN|nr:hypothetical protein [Actinoplanes ovalisporus]MBM2621370.1 hypothetical protein [Actinoplanes ovalisporus]